MSDTRTVGRYEIVREIGRGGMATVYLARQTDLDRFVALKELGAFHASDRSFAERFLRESRVAGGLSHPNIVTVYEYFEHDGTPYIAMEYVERGSLRPYVPRMTLAQVGGVLEGLLSALARAEQRGIVHRDLKPENLMVSSEGRVKITDFGIAKATTRIRKDVFPTATGTTVGTPAYMAPEQAMAQEIGPWTDLYSVGCMTFEFFAGRVPFDDSEVPMAILLRHVNEQIPPLKQIEPSVDQRISDWVEALLVKDPERRTRSASEAWDAYEEIMISLLGARWRREARLIDPAELPSPLTPAPFEAADVSATRAPPAGKKPAPSPIDPAPEFKTYMPPAPVRPPAQEAQEAQPPPQEAQPPAPAPAQAPPPEPAAAEPEAPPAPAAPAAAPPVRGTERDAARARPVIATTAMPEAVKRDREAPAKVRRVRKRRRLPAFPIVAAAAVLVTLALGVWAGGSGGAPTVDRKPTVVVSNAALKLTVPRGWSRLSTPPAVPGLSVNDAVAVSPGPRRGAGVIVFGQVSDADNPALLSTPLIEAGGGAPQAAVKLGAADLEAYRYRGLRPDGLDRRLTVYAVPTTAGVATVGCLAADRDFDRQCDRIANTLELLGGRSFPVGPSDEYARVVSRTLADLRRDAAAGRATLRGARTPGEQAAAARALARVYTRAAGRLGALEVSPADRTANLRLVQALDAGRAAFERAASAARAGDRAHYGQAGAAVTRGEQQLTDALDRLEAAGYRLVGQR